ncbi:DNA polymerase III subunit delta [Candidatus Peribacteria bacterium]|nr:MAG: DNA polymerase III subunit delta [Candidatus Peribacteria bacterium]
MAPFFLFTGENTFLLRTERHRWMQEFRKKHGEDNCTIIDGQKLTIRTLLDDVAVLPFLADKRLVIVDTVPKCSREEVQALAAGIHPQVIVAFCDPKPDKRSSGVKEILATADVKEFAPLKGSALRQWADTFARDEGATLEPAARDALIEFLGEDMDLLSQEIRKLALYATGRSVTRMDVEMMTIPSDEGIVWRMTDLLCEGSRIEALTYAKRMLDRGGDAYGLWAILLSMLKNLVLVRAAVQSGMTSSKDIADATAVHIFALRSLLPYAKRIKDEDTKRFLEWAVHADRDLKTGVIRSTDEAPQELQALIDEFILHSP